MKKKQQILRIRYSMILYSKYKCVWILKYVYHVYIKHIHWRIILHFKINKILIIWRWHLVEKLRCNLGRLYHILECLVSVLAACRDSYAYAPVPQSCFSCGWPVLKLQAPGISMAQTLLLQPSTAWIDGRFLSLSLSVSLTLKYSKNR